jgi:hypothetical protein
MPSNKSMQTDKGNLSCLLHSQKPRQLAFAADLGRWAGEGSALEQWNQITRRLWDFASY